MNFDKERKESIQKMCDDYGFDQLSLMWQKEASRYKYSYNFKWLGLPFIQMPQDIVAIQEVLWDEQPDFVVETGVARGGGVVFYASMLELMGRGKVIGVDIEIRPHNLDAIKKHKFSDRIELIEGSSIDLTVFNRIFQTVGKSKCVVVLDSMHTTEHVLKELVLYSKIASYILVLDTVIARFPNNAFEDRPWDSNNNPYFAVSEFMDNNNKGRFMYDYERFGKLMITTAPWGYLKRRK